MIHPFSIDRQPTHTEKKEPSQMGETDRVNSKTYQMTEFKANMFCYI